MSNATNLALNTYTVRGADGLPPIVWTSEVAFTGRSWQVTLWRNGHEQCAAIDPDDVPDVIGNYTRERARRHAIARKLLSLG